MGIAVYKYFRPAKEKLMVLFLFVFFLPINVDSILIFCLGVCFHSSLAHKTDSLTHPPLVA